MSQVVAYLGPSGTYSELAAKRLFERAIFTPCSSLDDVVQAVVRSAASAGVLPIENSTEGSVRQTLDVLGEAAVHIVGEVSLPIHHQLLTHAAVLADITEVAAHPQALAQCRKWLDVHLPQAKRVPAASNAEAAREASAPSQVSRAAIAGVHTAAIYSLPILHRNIEDNPRNITRFVAIAASPVGPTGHDKTTLACSLPNKAGSLHGLLGIFAKHSINLTKLESRPLPESAWDYLFYIDCDGHAQDAGLSAVLHEVQAYAVKYKVLGSYPRERSGG